MTMMRAGKSSFVMIPNLYIIVEPRDLFPRYRAAAHRLQSDIPEPIKELTYDGWQLEKLRKFEERGGSRQTGFLSVAPIH